MSITKVYYKSMLDSEEFRSLLLSTYRNIGDSAPCDDGFSRRVESGVYQVQQAPEHGAEAVPRENKVG